MKNYKEGQKNVVASVPATSVGEIEWYESIGKQLHKLKVRLDIILWSVFGISVILGYHLFSTYEAQYARIELGYLAMFLLPLTLILVACSVSDLLPKCYRQYICKKCGHIHRAKLDELDSESNWLHCENCNQKTRHKYVPVKK